MTTNVLCTQTRRAFRGARFPHVNSHVMGIRSPSVAPDSRAALSEAELILWGSAAHLGPSYVRSAERENMSETKRLPRPSLLVLSALLLCGLRQAAASRSPELKQTSGHRPPSPETGEAAAHASGSPLDTGRGRVWSDGSPGWSPEEGGSPLCAYRVTEGGIGGQLCFRRTLSGYKCHQGDCRTVVSAGNLLANILINGSVLLQWTREGRSPMTRQDVQTTGPPAGQRRREEAGTISTKEERPRPDTALGGRRHRREGFELSCWWNGSYTQFECAGVRLGSGCRDFLLTELHENIPYRICLRSLARFDGAQRADHRACVDFTLPQTGMQDIVIAMTAVGGAICVMLVIICLLVAYITENIMSPPMQHTYSYRTHMHH